MAIITTHAGGPYYKWRVRVMGKPPPATFDETKLEGVLYHDWQHGATPARAQQDYQRAQALTAASTNYLQGVVQATLPGAGPPPAVPAGLPPSGVYVPPQPPLAAPAPPAPADVVTATVAAASPQRQVWDELWRLGVPRTVTRVAFLIGTAENDWNTNTCNPSNHCGLFQLDATWQAQHDYHDVAYWTRFAVEHGFYNHGGIWQIVRSNPNWSIGEMVQACQGAGPTWQAATDYYNSRLAESDAILRGIEQGGAQVVQADQEYFNPLARARVVGERIDQGVDYAGTGQLVAIADANISSVAPGGWGKFGNYLEYKITQPGELQDAYVYYAEGIEPTVSYGRHVSAGQVIANIVPGWQFGMELGFAAGVSNHWSYYRYHDGNYQEGTATRPGIAFDNLVKRLGGPAGRIEGAVVGKFPSYMQSGFPSAAVSTSGAPTAGGVVGGPGFNAPGAAAAYDFPASMYSAWVQAQRGARNGSHHSHSAGVFAAQHTYVVKA